MIKVKCKLCNKEFFTHECWLKRGRGKYCSLLCRYKSTPRPDKALNAVKKLRMLGLFSVPKRGGSENKKCILCGKIFMFFKSQGKGLFCSKECYYKYKVGKPNGLKGYKWPKYRRIEKSKTNKRIGLIPPKNYGENNRNWKGGITPINEKIRKSEEYNIWRKAVYQRDKWTCIWCGYRGNRLHADHIKPFSLFPELRFSVDNGRTLCIDCHKKTDTYGWKFYNKEFKYKNNEDIPND